MADERLRDRWQGRQSTNVEDRRSMKPGAAQPPGYTPPDDVPPWFDDIRVRMGAQGNYETGDPTTDDFLRRRKMEQYDPRSWTGEAYRDPARAYEMLRRFHDAGRNGDSAAEEQLRRTQGDPFAGLLWRAYQEGRGRRGSSRTALRGIGMAVQ